MVSIVFVVVEPKKLNDNFIDNLVSKKSVTYLLKVSNFSKLF